jgi:hypothetical protein
VYTRLDHQIPDWVRFNITFFITICAQICGVNTFCLPALGEAILDSIEWRNEKQIWFATSPS